MGDDPDRSSNDYRMLLASLATVTLATSSALLWRASRRSPDSRSPPPDRTNAWHFVLSAWSRADPSTQPGAAEKLNERTDPDESANFSGLSPKESKTARSKERRRRGKDPVKDIRKIKDVLKPAKRVSSPVRSAPPLPPIQPPHVQRPPSLPKHVSPTDSSTPTQSPSTKHDSEPSVPPSDHALPARSPTPDRAHDLSYHDQPLLAVPEDLSHESRSVSSSSTSISSALLGPDPSMPSSSTSSPHRSTSSCASNKGSWDWDGQSTFYRDPTRFSAARKQPVPGSSSPQPGPSQTLRDPSYISPPLQSLSPASLPERLLSPSPSPSPAPGHPRASASRRAPTPSSFNGDNNSLSMQTQIASLKGALEATKMREEKQKAESDRLAKECDAMRWRWQEEIGGWRRREAELQGYIQYLTQTMHLYPVSPATHLQTLSPFSPLSPGPSPYANGFAPPPPNYGYPGPPPPLPPQAHALATFFPPSAPSSTGSGSPIPGPVRDRGRRRQRFQDEEEGEGDWIDPEDGYADEDEDELQLSDEVADAILKRPESLKVKKRPAPPVELGELRFPSISDWGNVWRESQEPVVSMEQEPEQEQERSNEATLVGEAEAQVGASTDAPREEQLVPSEDIRDDK